jgi:hypothetical protein
LNQLFYSSDSKIERKEVESFWGEMESVPAEDMFREFETKWK